MFRNQNAIKMASSNVFLWPHFGSIVTTVMFQFLLVVLTKTTFYDISIDFPPDFCAIVMLATIRQGYLKYCPWQYVQVQDKVQDKVKDKVQDQVQGMEKFSIGDANAIYSFQHWYKTTQFHRKCILCVSWNLRDPRLSCHLKRQGWWRKQIILNINIPILHLNIKILHLNIWISKASADLRKCESCVWILTETGSHQLLRARGDVSEKKTTIKTKYFFQRNLKVVVSPLYFLLFFYYFYSSKET